MNHAQMRGWHHPKATEQAHATQRWLRAAREDLNKALHDGLVNGTLRVDARKLRVLLDYDYSLSKWLGIEPQVEWWPVSDSPGAWWREWGALIEMNVRC